MKTLVCPKEVTAMSVNEVREQVKNLMKYYGYSFLFEEEEDIEKFYREEWGHAGNIKAELVQSFEIDGGEDDPVNGCSTQHVIKVWITAYYPDAGFDWEDYSYIIRAELF